MASVDNESCEFGKVRSPMKMRERRAEQRRKREGTAEEERDSRGKEENGGEDITSLQTSIPQISTNCFRDAEPLIVVEIGHIGIG